MRFSSCLRIEVYRVITSSLLEFSWLRHGFGLRDSVPPSDLTTVRQIHSVQILDACGRKGIAIGEGDAIISDQAGVTIGIRTADCVPILLADSVTRIVACVHAGWRGTAENIVSAAVRAMTEVGCRPASLRVAIGPSIGSCCYEVGNDVAIRFANWIAVNGERQALDLPAINRVQLLEAGVSDIWTSGECTFCQAERFFSFRREKERAGRMVSFVGRVA
jgi:polyphenol oxidase